MNILWALLSSLLKGVRIHIQAWVPVSVSEVVSAVKNGADTFEKVAETTGAGTACGRCKEIILNIIENKR